MVEKVTVVMDDAGSEYFLISEAVTKVFNIESNVQSLILKNVNTGEYINIDYKLFKLYFKVIFSNDQQWDHL